MKLEFSRTLNGRTEHEEEPFFASVIPGVISSLKVQIAAVLAGKRLAGVSFASARCVLSFI
jgi:hypothetical protein